MSLHKKTEQKIFDLLYYANCFIKELRKNELTPDVLFVVVSFENKFSLIFNRLKNKTFDIETFHGEIFDFDNILFNWMENLSYSIELTKNESNIYDVLFSVLQGINDLIDEDHFAWEKEEKEQIDEDDVSFECDEY